MNPDVEGVEGGDNKVLGYKVGGGVAIEDHPRCRVFWGRLEPYPDFYSVGSWCVAEG